MFQISDISLFAKLHFFQRINEDTYTFSSKWVKVFLNMSYWASLPKKDLTQIFGIYKNSSKKRFLDSMDLRETTYSGSPCQKNLTQIWGIYKIYSKK